jgi:hypothetical protein
MRMLGLVLALVMSSSAFAVTTEPPIYKITGTLFVNGQKLASQQIITAAGKSAEIKTMSDNHSESKMKVVANQIEGKDALQMKFEIEYRDDVHDIKMKPEIFSQLGSEAEVTVGKSGEEPVTLKVIATRQ